MVQSTHKMTKQWLNHKINRNLKTMIELQEKTYKPMVKSQENWKNNGCFKRHSHRIMAESKDIVTGQLLDHKTKWQNNG